MSKGFGCGNAGKADAVRARRWREREEQRAMHREEKALKKEVKKEEKQKHKT